MLRRSHKRQRPRRPLHTSIINEPLVDLGRVMIARNGIGMGTSDGPVGSAGRINTSWFRLGYTPASGIPGITPNSGPDEQDEMGSADVDGADFVYGTGGIVRVARFKDDSEYNFKAFNPNVGTAPGNTLTTFVRTLGLWVPLSASPSSHFGIIVDAIQPRVGTKAGNGFVKIKIVDKNGNITDPDPLPDPPNLETWNWAAASFQAGKYCWIEQDNTGKYFLVSCEC